MAHGDRSVWARRGWPALFGPVLFVEMLRAGRRPRYITVRCVYGLLLLLVLLGVYAAWVPEVLDNSGRLFARNALAVRDLANFSASFFSTFLVMQLGAVLLLTPAYTAGAIAEEKERHTLDQLLATDLSGREIVLGKTAARFANLLLVLLTGLPILGGLQFLGGVDPNFVLAGFTATAVTAASLTGIGILNSARARKPRDAVTRTYLAALAYLLLSGASWLLLLPVWKLANYPSTEEWTSPITVEDVVWAVNVGNPFSVPYMIATDARAGGDLAAAMGSALARYAAFHLLIATGCLAWAVFRFRARALRQEADRVEHAADEAPSLVRGLLTGARPRVFNPCVVWKEVFAEERSRGGRVRKLAAGVLLAALFWPAVQTFHYFGRVLPLGPNDQLGPNLNVWVRGACLVLGGCAWLAVAIRAAGSVSGERTRQTFDSLLTTPLGNRSILFGKWLGAILSPRRLALWLGVVCVIGLMTNGLHPLAVPFLFVTWLSFAAVAAGVGLWASVVSGGTHRAMLMTVLVLAALHLIAAAAAWDLPEGWIKPLSPAVLTPLGTLAMVPFAAGELTVETASRVIFAPPLVPAFAAGWAVVAAGLWVLACVRFRVVTRREGVPKKERRGVSPPVLVASLAEEPAGSRRAALGARERGGS